MTIAAVAITMVVTAMEIGYWILYRLAKCMSREEKEMAARIEVLQEGMSTMSATRDFVALSKGRREVIALEKSIASAQATRQTSEAAKHLSAFRTYHSGAVYMLLVALFWGSDIAYVPARWMGPLYPLLSISAASDNSLGTVPFLIAAQITISAFATLVVRSCGVYEAGVSSRKTL